MKREREWERVEGEEREEGGVEGGGQKREVTGPARKTKQGVYVNHDNLKQKTSVWFVSLKVLEVTFCVEAG